MDTPNPFDPNVIIPQIEIVVQQTIGFMPRLIAAIIIFMIFWIIGAIFRRVVNRYGKRTKLDPEIRDLLARVVRLTILIVGVITALGTVGIDVTALVAGLGLTGFALGFALQDIISNLLSGILLTMQRPFRRGNYIRVGDKEGYVVDMDLRYTWLRQDTTTILIPNSVMFKESIVILATNAPQPMPPQQYMQPPR
jgi:small-conductance mechanosensitive channel